MTKNLLFFIALSALLPLALISCDNSSSPPLIPISIANPTSGNPTSGNPNDWDGDGLSNLDEMNVHHTNPYDADTDGDGYNDYEEAVTLKNDNTNKFNPLIADTPEVQIEITATPAITLIKTSSVGQTEQESVTESTGQTKTSSTSNSRSRSASWEGGFTVGASYTHNWGVTNGSATDSLTISGSTSWKWVRGNTSTFSATESFALAQSYATTKAKSATQTVNYTGGVIGVPVKIKNTSNIAYVVKNITLEAYKISYDGNNGQNSSAVTNLYPGSQAAGADPTAANATIPAGGEAEIKFTSGQLPVGAIESIMNGLVGFRVEVSTLLISSEDTKDFTKIKTAVDAKDALLTVDYGPCFASTKMPIAQTLPEPKSFQVATKRTPDSIAGAAPKSYDKLTLTQALADCLPNVVEYFEDDSGHKMIKKIHGVEGKFTNASGMEGDWFVAHVSYENSLAKVQYYGPSAADKYYNADQISVSAGDDINIMYSVDKDGDGIPLRQEEIFGTDDDKTDTDGDTISDYAELTGWTVASNGIKTCSNPALADTDGDGLNDNEDPYPTISNILSNAYLESVAVSYTPFSRASYDRGKNINLDISMLDSSVMRNSECEVLNLVSIDPSATNPDGSSQIVYALKGGEIPSSAFVLKPKVPYGIVTYEYYLINGWAKKDAGYDAVTGVKTYGNAEYAGLTTNEYNDKTLLSEFGSDGVLNCQTLPIGKFKIALKATSSDGSKTVWYVIRFDAPLEVPNNAKAGVTSGDGQNAEVALSWAGVTDSRATKVLVVRSLASAANASFVPEHDAIVAAEERTIQNDVSTSPLYLVYDKDSVQAIDHIKWASGCWYYFYTYSKSTSGNEITVSSLGSPVNAIANLPDSFNVTAKFNMLTITDDFGDDGHTFELKWEIWKQQDGGVEELVNNHTEKWEGDYDNVRKPNWYSLANEESEAIFANIDKNSNHYLTVRIRLREVDDGGSDDDIDNIYFDLFYDASTKKLTYDKSKHNSGANSRNSMTPAEFVFGQATPTRFYFDPEDGEESVKGYFDLTLTWGK